MAPRFGVFTYFIYLCCDGPGPQPSRSGSSARIRNRFGMKGAANLTMQQHAPIPSELVKKYKARTVVDHVSIDVNQGEIVGLLGPNGAGKTTTFYMIVGLIKPNEGRIFLENDEGQVAELTNEPVYKRAQMGVAIWRRKRRFSAACRSRTTFAPCSK